VKPGNRRLDCAEDTLSALLSRQKRKVHCLVLCVVAIVLCTTAEAQQLKKLYRLGVLSPSDSLDSSPADQAFRHSLRELGLVEGQNTAIEWRFAKGNSRLFSDLAAELVRLNVDCIVTRGIPAVRSAKAATSTTPIVMNVSDDPVQLGLISSLGRPGNNITGFVNISAELSGKRLELLTQTLPKAQTIGHLWGGQTGAAHFREIESAGRALRIQLKPLELKSPGDLENAFRTASKNTDAVIVVAASWINNHRKRIIDLATNSKLPAMYTLPHIVQEGGLMSYAGDRLEQYRVSAAYVDKILKGAKPGDLPVQQPTKFELLINLKTAKQIGLKIPANVLARADRVIR
jgi:putative ABC transport system substrate-binding protein